jgi:hypothetical protein
MKPHSSQRIGLLSAISWLPQRLRPFLLGDCEMWTGLPKLDLIGEFFTFLGGRKFGKVFVFGCALNQGFAPDRL